MNRSPVPSPIFLIGFMGTGKSTVGRIMARITGFSYLELDDCIEQQARMSVGELFHESGEEHFRKIETDVLRGLDLKSESIISTGGGTPVFHGNMEWMKAHGTVVHLQCRPGVLFHRLSPEKAARPLLSELTDVELMGFIIDTLKSRLHYYSQANVQVNAEKKPDEVAREILHGLNINITNS